jgi:hypothetical protein
VRRFDGDRARRAVSPVDGSRGIGPGTHINRVGKKNDSNC